MPELPRLSPIASEPLSVVLLTRNQASHLEALLAAWVTFLNGLDREFELIVVDDGSTDGTGELAEKLTAGYRRVVVRRHERAQGEGAALLCKSRFWAFAWSRRSRWNRMSVGVSAWPPANTTAKPCWW